MIEVILQTVILTLFAVAVVREGLKPHTEVYMLTMVMLVAGFLSGIWRVLVLASS